MGICSRLAGFPPEEPCCLTHQAMTEQKPPSSLLLNSPSPLKSPGASLAST